MERERACPDYERDHHVISTRLSAGRTVIHVYADERPADSGFERVRTELTDVYFSTLKRVADDVDAAA